MIGMQSDDEIKIICEKLGIYNYDINSDGSIDTWADVRLSRKYLTELPIRFNNCYGGFYCDSNSLRSLKGVPRVVAGAFNCSRNNLTTLEHCPIEIYGFFSCEDNQITSLDYFPELIAGSIYIKQNLYIKDNNYYKKLYSLIANENYGINLGNLYTRYDIGILDDDDESELYSWILSKERQDTINNIINS